jgi:hypothetical protein
MSSMDTALRVLAWAAAPDGPPPEGDPAALHVMADPPPALLQAQRDLLAVAAARFGFQSPLLADPRPATAYAGILALAIGVRHWEQFPRVLVDAAPACRSAAEFVLRHALVAPVLPHLAASLPALADDCVRVSPLTAAFDYPRAGNEGDAQAVCATLRAHPQGRRALIMTLATPTPSAHVRRWRTTLLDQWRAGSREDSDLMLDIYETTMVFHEDEALAQIQRAGAALADASAISNERLEDAQSVADWWGPLAVLERNDIARLRARTYLGYNYRPGLQLFRSIRRRVTA